MVLKTKLEHLRSKLKFQKLIKENEKVIIIAGRMCQVCKSMYPIFEKLDKMHPEIQIRDWDYDLESADIIRELPECEDFWTLPFVVYFRNGDVVAATSGKQTSKEIIRLIQTHFDEN